MYIIKKKKKSERKDHETRQDNIKKELVNDTLMDTLGVKND